MVQPYPGFFDWYGVKLQLVNNVCEKMIAIITNLSS